MDRLHFIQQHIDEQIEKLHNPNLKKLAYLHTYGVFQLASLLAIKRNINIEHAKICALLHDISENASRKEHAKRSSIYAQKLLTSSSLFEKDEIQKICDAILTHSDKATRNDSELGELLKDADLLQHYLFDPANVIEKNAQFRLYYVLEEIKK